MEHNTQEIMTKKLVTIPYKATLIEAYEIMAKRKIRHLPVTDHNQQIIGIISDRDLQRAMRPEKISDRSSTTNSYGVDVALTFDPTFEVRDFMSFPIKEVEQTMTIEAVATRMLHDKVSAYIVTQRTRPVGIVTTDDMLKFLVQMLRDDPSSLRKTIDGFVEIWDPLY
jgi:CBS domain-containing protein